MKRLTLNLNVLWVLLLIGSLIAWFVEPSRKVDWISLFVVSIAVWTVSGRVAEIEKRLENLEVLTKSQ